MLLYDSTNDVNFTEWCQSYSIDAHIGNGIKPNIESDVIEMIRSDGQQYNSAYNFAWCSMYTKNCNVSTSLSQRTFLILIPSKGHAKLRMSASFFVYFDFTEHKTMLQHNYFAV